MGKHNKGRFKTRAVPSINSAPPTAATTNTTLTSTTVTNLPTAADAAQLAQADNSMSIDITPSTALSITSSSLAPLSPTISLSRPFHPPQDSLLPPLAAASASALTPITLPSAIPASRPLNGRQWRHPTQPPTRSLTPHSHKKGWSRHQSERQQRAELKVKASEMEKMAREVRVEERRKREQRAKMKVENEKKNRVVQVIKDSAKIKRMSRAQLKMIEKA